MCLWNTDAPDGNKVKIWQKSLSPTFWPTQPQGAWDVSEVWGTLKWTYSPSLVTVSSPKLLFLDLICKRDGITDRRTNRQTDKPMDGQMIQLLDAPTDLSGRRYKKCEQTHDEYFAEANKAIDLTELTCFRVVSDTPQFVQSFLPSPWPLVQQYLTQLFCEAEYRISDMVCSWQCIHLVSSAEPDNSMFRVNFQHVHGNVNGIFKTLNTLSFSWISTLGPR